MLHVLVAAGALSFAGCSKSNEHGAAPGTPAGQAAPAATAGQAGDGGHGSAAAAHGSAAAATGAAAAAPAPSADGRKVLGGITVQAPSGWTEQAVTSSMRRGQWKIPGEAGEAELVVYYFGAGGAGTVEKNLDRWFSQFEQPDGRPTRDAAKVENKNIGGMNVTRVAVGGRYVAEVRPGAGERVDVPNARMLAAIVEAPDGAYYFKMVGPEATVQAAEAGFEALLGSLARSN